MWLTVLSTYKKQVGKRKLTKVRANLHIRRIRVDIRTSEGAPIESGHMLLNDMNTQKAEIFVSHKFNDGDSILLTIHHIAELTLKARITWCQEHRSDSHIQSSHSFLYRLGIEFGVDGAEGEQKTIVEDYLRKVLSFDPQHAVYPAISTALPSAPVTTANAAPAVADPTVAPEADGAAELPKAA